jgi:putative hemolysin
MDIGTAVFFFLLLGLSAFFSGSETALMSVDRIALHRRAREGNRTAALIERQRERPHRMLSALLIGNNLVNVAATALATTIAVRLLGQNRGILAATVIATTMIVFFSEILPKTAAALRPWLICRFAARPIWLLENALRPVVALLDLATRPLMRLLGRRTGRLSPGLDELRALVSLARGSEVPPSVLEIVDRSLHLGRVTAEEVMVPRVRAVMVARGMTLAEAVALQRRKGHSRFPVYEGDPDRVVGFLHISEILRRPTATWEEITAGEIIRPVLQIPGTTTLTDLLRQMQARAIHMAVVLDEYGGTDGIVTMEDVLEEVVGSILDEMDVDREEEIVRLGDDRYRVRGPVSLAFLARETGVDLSHEDVATVGGLIQHLLARPAQAGDTVSWNGFELRVERLTRRGVALAGIRRAEPRREDENR